MLDEMDSAKFLPEGQSEGETDPESKETAKEMNATEVDRIEVEDELEGRGGAEEHEADKDPDIEVEAEANSSRFK